MTILDVAIETPSSTSSPIDLVPLRPIHGETTLMPRFGAVRKPILPLSKKTDSLEKSLEQTKQALLQWRTKHASRWNQLKEQLQFVIPIGYRVLVVGSEDGELLHALSPSKGVGLDGDANLVRIAQQLRSQYEHETLDEADFDAMGVFDYIVFLWGASSILDVQTMLPKLRSVSHPRTRLVVTSPTKKWLDGDRHRTCSYTTNTKRQVPSIHLAHLSSIIANAGFEITATHGTRQRSVADHGITRITRKAIAWLPGAHSRNNLVTIVARPVSEPTDADSKSASVVLVMRNERDNVEPIIQAIPKLGVATEIIIVEGHSTDGTREEIERVISNEPSKRIRLLPQHGDGIADAIKQGFDAAIGDVVILLEADQTSPPKDIAPIFEAIASGSAEFVNGSRFMLKREPGAMSIRNVLGNWLFAKWLSWLTHKRVTDIFCGLKGIDRKMFGRLSANWGFTGMQDPFSDLELSLGAAKLGLKTSEVPTHYKSRPYGVSKIHFYRNGWTLGRIALKATDIFRCQ